MILFHQTNKKNIPTILSEGLKKSCSNFWKGLGGCIYLSNIIGKFGDVTLAINISGLDISRVSEWEYICWDDVPSENIQINDAKAALAELEALK